MKRSMSAGQGHETSFAQVISEWLGVDFTTVRMIQGDTDQVGFGRGTYGIAAASQA